MIIEISNQKSMYLILLLYKNSGRITLNLERMLLAVVDDL
jgi:hypothetical protein